MNGFERERYSDQECIETFRELFPQGFAGADVIAEIAPEGWDRSPLVAIFHPSLEQVFREAIDSHRNLQELRRSGGKDLEPPPTLEQVRARFQEAPVNPLREPAELVGRCAWDIFSDNHEVLCPDNRVVDIGSFRGAGGFIADELNRQIEQTRYGCMDFFMGTSWITCRADVTIVYEMIFKRLHAWQLEWVYHFPRLSLIDLQPLRESLTPDDSHNWQEYSPESALARERAEQERRQRLAEMKRNMEEDHARSLEGARAGPPPRTVVAYQRVYGRLPRGWPPEELDGAHGGR